MARALVGLRTPSLRRCIVAMPTLPIILGILILALPVTSAAAELAALQRAVDDTRNVAAEVAKAVQRVVQDNEAVRTDLSAEARNLAAAGITAPMLRSASLDVDTARSRLRTTDNRIERREQEIELLDQQLQLIAATSQAGVEDSPAAQGAEVEQRTRRDLRTVSAELVDGLHRLADAEAEHLMLAEERLALLQSRAELRAIRDESGFEQNPQVTALRAIVSRHTRDGTRLANEAAAIETSATDNGLRKRLLLLQADDAISRATQRLVDLDLLRIRSHIAFFDQLAANRAVPLRIVRDGRRELDVLRIRLDDQLRDLALERDALQDRRELIHGQGDDAGELKDMQLELVRNMEELLDFQQADVGELQKEVSAAAVLLDAELGGRELQALTQRRAMQLDPHRRSLLQSELALLPTTILDHLHQLANDIGERLVSSPGRLSARIAGALAALGLVLWWLHRAGLRMLVARDPDGLPSIPIEALRRALPALLPSLAWLVLASTVGLDPPSTWLLAGALALWPLVMFLLYIHDLLAARTERVSRAGRWTRMSLIAAAGIGVVVLVIHASPILPSLADLVDRIGFLGVGLAAFGTVTLRRALLAALRGWPEMSPAWLRLLEVATAAVPGLLALAAVGGLAGWVDLGWTIAAAVGAAASALGLVVGVACALRNLTLPLRTLVENGSDALAVDAALRLVVILLAIGASWFIASSYTDSIAVTASFWVFAIAIALPFVLQPIEVLVELLLRIDPDHRKNGSVSVLAICVDRGVRALLIVGAVLGLASLLDIDLAALATGDTFQAQIVRAGFNIALIALLADFVWQLAKTMIDQRLALEGDGDAAHTAEEGGEGGGKGASRLRTLLPLLRKFLMITLAVIVVMLVLSSFGVNIGPLLAGAGVVGIAIGFGAQTLVRDIVSGVFFLMDDAFRLGEYVDVGAVKGTVEHISVRSMRLRHHRGALHTIPFGEITHLSNFSRDWVIMKLEFRVPFDTDMRKVKKIFKKIGAEMMADETIGPNLLDPPKSQGVFQMDDSAMIVRAKFMAKPGEQFVIRRELYHAVQREFEAAGIEFARRQVSVFVPPDADVDTAAAAAQAAAIEDQAGGKKGVQAAE